MSTQTLNNFDVLKQSCPMLTVEQWSFGACKHGKRWKNNVCFHYCPTCISARHARLNKNGKSVAYGDRYCAKLLVEASHHGDMVPFASSEINAMKKYFGYAT